jgi:NadR type nicotinamide-nucleotide adenylyltransferase
VKTIAVVGPESTGKSTLCKMLASHFQTIWQPEWARNYLGERHCTYDDMEIIVQGHFAEYSKYKANARKILFMDTEAVTTLVYSRHYYGKVPLYVQEMANRMHEFVDMYLLTDIDVPWVADTSRDLGEPWQRQKIRRDIQTQLERRNLPYTIIRGEWNERFRLAVHTVDQMLTRYNVPKK